MNRVDGLCGLYNDDAGDDHMMRDGSLAQTTDRFGDSWTVHGNPPDECSIEQCPFHVQKAAWDSCAFLGFVFVS